MPDTPASPLIHLAANVWYFRRDTTEGVIQPNVGVIRGDNATILIDAGNSPHHARRITTELAAHGFPPVKTIIYTHHHFDHVFGAMDFNAEHIIAHQLCDTILQQWHTRTWNPTLLQEEISQNPRLLARNMGMMQAIQQWRDFYIVLPTLSFQQTLTLYLDEQTTLHLAHVGGVHAEDSITVTIPEAGVMFMGDSYYPPPFHLRTPHNADDLALDMLHEFVARDLAIYLDGHGDPRSREDMLTLIQTEEQRRISP